MRIKRGEPVFPNDCPTWAEIAQLPDSALVQVRESSPTLFYAQIRISGKVWISDPDFSTGALTRENAVESCAWKIRNDLRGIGKYAPHFDAYDVLYRLLPAWREAVKVEA